MQDRQTQVRAGSASAVGRLRETDGMVMGRSAATDQWTSYWVIQPDELPSVAEPWLSRTWTLFLTIWLYFCLSSQSDPDCLSSGLTLALLPSAEESFTKHPLTRCSKRTERKSEGVLCLLYISFAPPLSLSSHVSLPLYPSKSHHF